MNKKIIKSLDEVNDILANVSASYAVWRELTDFENKNKYEITREQYDQFFFIIDHANFAMVVNGLNMLFEDKDNTHNIKSVLLMHRVLSGLFEASVDKWIKEIDSWAAVIKKIRMLRSNVYAHRSNKGSANDFMMRVEITPNEVGKLITSTELLMKEFTKVVGVNTSVISNSGHETRESTRKLMTDLRECNKQKKADQRSAF